MAWVLDLDGVVPITVSGGVVGLTLHRPPGVAVTAHVSAGTARIKLDAFAARALTSDLDWESPGASASADRYELRVNGGAIQVTLDDQATPFSPPSFEPARPAPVEGASALGILLDGVARRVGRSQSSAGSGR
jgi:hypothetical protein